jgi:hypothetical protein
LSLAAFAQSPQEERTRHAAESLAAEALRAQDAYKNLGVLCDSVGHRLSGSPQYDLAVQWALRQMKADGLQNVHAEKVMVPAWRRNTEHAELIAPARHSLSILGLGMSVPTPKGGVTAEVVVVGSFAELEKLPSEKVKDRIVLFDVPFTGYGATARYRVLGASAAAKKGAVGALVRSLSPVSLDTPHTGVLHYQEDAPKIPAAAVSMENATMMRRMWERGERITLHLEMACEQLPDVAAANVVGEVVGSEKPEEIVLVSGHLDSWDVGQGAQDDGVGCALALEAGHLIQRLGLKPRRTVRVVLFANEENGNRGGLGYLEAHRQELSKHVAAMESDSGNGLAKGLGLELHDPKGGPVMDKERALARFRSLLKPYLEPLGAGVLEAGGSGVDVEPIVAAGVPGVGVEHDVTHYWDVHHSKADTFDKINREDLAKNSAIVAIATFLLADMPERLEK